MSVAVDQTMISIDQLSQVEVPNAIHNKSMAPSSDLPKGL